MLMYDCYKKTYYEVIPVSKIEEKIQELYLEKETDDDEMFTFREIDITQNKIDILQQLIDENKEEE